MEDGEGGRHSRERNNYLHVPHNNHTQDHTMFLSGASKLLGSGAAPLWSGASTLLGSGAAQLKSGAS